MTVPEARRMAGEALDLHVEGMLEDGESLPTTIAVNVVMADPDNAGAVAFLVPCPRGAGDVA